MATGKAVWGIDIGHSALKALKLRAAGDKAEVLAFDFIEHAKVLSQPDADRNALIAEALVKLSSRHVMAKDKLVVAVPGQQTLSRFTKLPPVEPKKIPDIVRYEAEQQIPFDMDEVVWDYQVFTSESSPDVEVGIFAMKRELIYEYLTHYANLNMEIAVVQAAPLALYNALFFDGRCGEEPTVILDIGAQNTDLVVAAGPSLWTRTINIGGNHFTESLVKAFKLSFPKAEALKRTASTSKYARQIFQAMRPVFADLVAEVQRSIGFYASSHREVKLKKIAGMGNAFKMPGLQKFLQQSLGMEVTRLSEFHRLTPPSEGNTTDYTDNLLAFGVAYGLAVQGLGLSKVSSGLLPPEIARQVVWRKKNPWFAGAAASLVLAAGTIWLRYLMDDSALESAGSTLVPPAMGYEQAKLEYERGPNESEPPRDFANKWLAVAWTFQREYDTRVRDRQEQEQQIEEYLGLHTQKNLWLNVLAELHDALPEEPALAGLQGPAEYRQAIAGNPALARPNRKEIFIESLDSDYASNVYQSLEAMSDSSRAGRDRRAAARGPRGAGFALEMRVRTPNAAGANFVEQTLIAHLSRKDRPESLGYYFDRIRIVEALKFSQQDASAQRSGAARRPGTPTGVESQQTQKLDPITGEPMEDDWLCTIHMAAVLGTPPKTEDQAADKPRDARGEPPSGGESDQER